MTSKAQELIAAGKAVIYRRPEQTPAVNPNDAILRGHVPPREPRPGCEFLELDTEQGFTRIGKQDISPWFVPGQILQATAEDGTITEYEVVEFHVRGDRKPGRIEVRRQS
jgi:hypothetical protein